MQRWIQVSMHSWEGRMQSTPQMFSYISEISAWLISFHNEKKKSPTMGLSTSHLLSMHTTTTLKIVSMDLDFDTFDTLITLLSDVAKSFHHASVVT